MPQNEGRSESRQDSQVRPFGLKLQNYHSRHCRLLSSALLSSSTNQPEYSHEQFQRGSIFSALASLFLALLGLRSRSSFVGVLLLFFSCFPSKCGCHQVVVFWRGAILCLRDHTCCELGRGCHDIAASPRAFWPLGAQHMQVPRLHLDWLANEQPLPPPIPCWEPSQRQEQRFTCLALINHGSSGDEGVMSSPTLLLCLLSHTDPQ